MDLHSAFKYGARKLAKDNCAYSELHKGHGIQEDHWRLLTSTEYWTQQEARQIRAILANAIEVSMTIAGMPAIPLPGQYVAAFIVEVVAPCNRYLAAIMAPDTFDAVDASGLLSTHEVKTMPREQMLALVLAYSGGYDGEPNASRVPKAVEATQAADNLKEIKRK